MRGCEPSSKRYHYKVHRSSKGGVCWLPLLIFAVLFFKFGFFSLIFLAFLWMAFSRGNWHYEDQDNGGKLKNEKRKNNEVTVKRDGGQPRYIRTADGEWLEIID